eukprot:CAMPEP_0206327434 /NCGR_PEP_ID=MMETSP0106_2-20121207/22145_1 /ASSEMBLY_ACC=CAM_ASM_000206 /TAXON_ID=81532 /ORGANISM="Acanthoeca-like sp., Strain 10tr" /LENGTH=44 /DNA_ID= /DNA_START= /DNA_END= /DNA_ORIENTATION=
MGATQHLDRDHEVQQRQNHQSLAQSMTSLAEGRPLHRYGKRAFN